MSTRDISNRPVSSTHNLLPRIALGAALAAMTLAGCNKNASDATNPDGTAANDPNSQDPTLANMAPVDNAAPAQQQAPFQSSAQHPTQVAGYQQQAQPTQQSYANPAPIERIAPSADQYGDQNDTNGDYDAAETGYNATLTDVSAPQPPPPLPTYEQPEAPDPNYLWTPGYWNYAPQGYYWVPGAWVQPPYIGALWTPGYWGGYGNGYRFHRGFWATHIGFYGGISYGFGYFGTGYQGGYWNGDNFYYNRACNRVNDRVVRNVYQRNVVINNTVINNTTINNRTINNVSYNGGRGGVQVQPRPAELAVLREQRVAPMQAQVQHQQQAAQDRQQFYAQNHGRPTIVAAVRPLPADRGIAAPAHTTAQLDRALPVVQQIRQQEQFMRQGPRASNIARPTNQLDQPNRTLPNDARRPSVERQQPIEQNRQGNVNQPNRPGQPLNRPMNQAVERQENRQPQGMRPQPQQQPARPMPSQQPMRPAPQHQAVRPEAQTVRPQLEPRPQIQQARPQAQPSRPHQESRPQQAPQPHPEPHARH